MKYTDEAQKAETVLYAGALSTRNFLCAYSACGKEGLAC